MLDTYVNNKVGAEKDKKTHSLQEMTGFFIILRYGFLTSFIILIIEGVKNCFKRPKLLFINIFQFFKTLLVTLLFAFVTLAFKIKMFVFRCN